MVLRTDSDETLGDVVASLGTTVVGGIGPEELGKKSRRVWVIHYINFRL